MKVIDLLIKLQSLPGNSEIVFWDGLEQHDIGVIHNNEGEVVLNCGECLDWDDTIDWDNHD